MLFPSWIEETLDAIREALPLLVLITAVAVVWWRSLRPV
jgi:hypothetical protein